MTTRKGVGVFMLRGALCGIIVCLLLIVRAAINYKSRLGYVPYKNVFIIKGIPMAVIWGSGVGGALGLIIWICLKLLRRDGKQ
jgi:hypothetical protein